MSILVIDVWGVPETQGSMRAFTTKGGKAIVTSDNRALRPWRETVTNAARDAVEAQSWSRVAGPVRVECNFWLPRPKSAPRTRDILPVRGKDADKMLRSVYDSLTNAGVWVDDAQVCSGEFTKRYVVGPDLPKIYLEHFHRSGPGVVISLMELPE